MKNLGEPGFNPSDSIETEWCKVISVRSPDQILPYCVILTGDGGDKIKGVERKSRKDRKKLLLSQFYGRDISSETGFLDAYLFHIIAIANLIFLLVLLFCSW